MNKTVLLISLLLAGAAFGDASQYFKIKVIDEQTGRGRNQEVAVCDPATEQRIAAAKPLERR